MVECMSQSKTGDVNDAAADANALRGGREGRRDGGRGQAATYLWVRT